MCCVRGMAASSTGEAGMAGVVVVHGGAWDVPQHMWEASLEGVKAAARCGHQVSASTTKITILPLSYLLLITHCTC